MTTRRGVFGSEAFAVGLAQSVVCVALGVVALLLVPKFERLFKDFGTRLTAITVDVLDFTHFLGRYYYLALLPVILWPLANSCIVSLVSPRPEAVLPKRLWYFTTWAILLLVLVFSVFALFRPLVFP